jgi:hypothetical protein
VHCVRSFYDAARINVASNRPKSRGYSGVVSDTDQVPDEGPATEAATTSVSASAIKTHLTLVVGLALCTAAFVFELGRAEGGNELSWAYVFEWPLLGLFALYMWWKVLHPGFTFRRVKEPPAVAPEYEGMLRAWQGEVAKLERNRKAEEVAEQSDGGAVTLDE